MTEENLKLAAKQLGEGVEFDGWLSQIAELKNRCANDASDVLGWHYIAKADGICYSYYGAQYPLLGLTRAEPCKCPLGVRTFKDYKIDFKKAIDIFHTAKCGEVFIEMSIYYVLHPEVKEPCWYIRSVTGCTAVIGADSGKIMEPVYKE
jgi:hypothetical protein